MVIVATNGSMELETVPPAKEKYLTQSPTHQTHPLQLPLMIGLKDAAATLTVL